MQKELTVIAIGMSSNETKSCSWDLVKLPKVELRATKLLIIDGS